MEKKIIVATHKKYWMPSGRIYLPVHVGAEGKESIGYTPDNTGDNISMKNANYCELTGMYWAWKNLKADYIGLVHYRRHFTVKCKGDKKDRPISDEELEALISNYEVILPKKRNYFIETNYSQYVHAHHAIDLEATRQIIAEKYPEYLEAYDASMKKKSGHRFNMFIMKRDIFDAYCEWLFSILFELEERLDISDYNNNDARVFGFVSERLLDPWIETNNIDYKEIPYIFMEKQNWLIKGGNFIKRKLVNNGK